MNDIIDKSEIIHELDNYEKGKGSWVYSEVNGVRTKVYTKYLTGTTAAAAGTSVAHGITDFNKILPPVAVSIWNNTIGLYFVYDDNSANDPSRCYEVRYSAATIQLVNVAAELRNMKYRLAITWYE